MEIIEYTVLEIASKISTSKKPVSTDATRKRLERSGYTPARYIGVNAMFKLSEEDLNKLKNADSRGRPKADPEAKNKQKSKPKKTTKKA